MTEPIRCPECDTTVFMELRSLVGTERHYVHTAGDGPSHSWGADGTHEFINIHEECTDSAPWQCENEHVIEDADLIEKIEAL